MNNIVKGLILTVFICLLTNCASVSDNHLQVNEKLASPYTMPAAAYLSMAKNQEGEKQQALKIMAAGRLIYDGNWQQGRIILTRLKPMTDEIAEKKNLLLAKINLIRSRPTTAIRTLAKIKNIDKLSLYYQSQYHEMLAEAYQERGDITNAVSERSKLNQILPDATSKQNNLRSQWLLLTSLPDSELNTLSIESDDGSETKGWMTLAQISHYQYQKPNEMLDAIKDWQSIYPQHPANSLLKTSSGDAYLFKKPRNIALLLPTSGPISGPGRAIRDGFMSAYKSSKESGLININTYDTHHADIVSLYERAIQDGADYVVGPLSKPDVAKVAELSHPVPTLLLNDLNHPTQGQAYQFGLSPESEARQVASKARKSGYTKALVIAPNDAWGEAVVDAFKNQWQAGGGQVVDQFDYEKSANLNQSIKDFLHISQSQARKKSLQSVLGESLRSTPRRRQDFDMIFLLAYPSKARQIMPLLKYYYAGDVPVYSTSAVYGGYPSSMKNRDLDGIIFCDMPWIFNHNLGHKNWPEKLNSYNRLYALGLDSYVLSTQLNQLLLFPAMGVRDNSGVLYLRQDNQIARILAWGQFKNGLAKEISQRT